MVKKLIKQGAFVALLMAWTSLAQGECKVLIVVGMPDEAEAAQVTNAQYTEILVGTGQVSVLRERLEEIEPDSIKAVISFGVAGGLNPAYNEGDIVLATKSLYHDQVIEADETLRMFLREQAEGIPEITIKEGVYVSDDHWLGLESGESQALFETTQADITDNESFFAAEFAQHNHLPFAGIRTISDGPDVTLPPAALLPLDSDGSPDLWAVLGSVVMQPSQLSDLWALSERYTNALNRLNLFMQSVNFRSYLQEQFDECK